MSIVSLMLPYECPDFRICRAYPEVSLLPCLLCFSVHANHGGLLSLEGWPLVSVGKDVDLVFPVYI
jgi:hypothetical protein